MLNEFIWTGEKDYNWEGISNLLVKTSKKFSENMIRTVEMSPIYESRLLISDKCMERFEQITEVLADIIMKGDHYDYEDIFEDSQNALRLNSWILLGSLTESALQMFLAFYIEDYKETKWKLWEQFENEQVKKAIFECIQKLLDEGKIEKKHSKSLKNAIRGKIKEHTKERSVETIMLDELIQLYQYLELLSVDELTYLKKIQSNRNGIHSFQNRNIGNWSDLWYCIRFFCYLLEWIMHHLPDVPDYEDFY